MRIERDSMGEVPVPAGAYYGASTQRAVDNFPISDLRFGRTFIWAMGLLKASAASTNASIGAIDDAAAIAGHSRRPRRTAIRTRRRFRTSRRSGRSTRDS